MLPDYGCRDNFFMDKLSHSFQFVSFFMLIQLRRNYKALGITNMRISLHRSNSDGFFFIEMVYRQIPEKMSNLSEYCYSLAA